MSKIKQIVFISVLIIVTLFAMVYLQNKRIKVMETEMDSLNQLIEQQEADLDQLQTRLEELRQVQNETVTIEDPYWFWEAYGYPSTPEAVLKSLEGQNALIPFEGVLGGTPFIVPGESKIIDPQYAYALIEDGHMVGGLLLKYEFINDSQVEWTVVDGWWPSSN